MEQQFVITHQYITSQETEKTWQILKRPRFKHAMFLQKYESNFLWIQDINRECVCNPTLVMKESQSDELYGLWQTVVS
jgi:hypothetical protein